MELDEGTYKYIKENYALCATYCKYSDSKGFCKDSIRKKTPKDAKCFGLPWLLMLPPRNMENIPDDCYRHFWKVKYGIS